MTEDIKKEVNLGEFAASATNRKFLIRLFALSGYMFFIAAFACLIYLVVYLNNVGFEKPNIDFNTYNEEIAYYLSQFSTPAIFLIASLVAGIVGYLLMRFIFSTSKKIIPDDDRKLLEEIIRLKEEEPIKRYIALSSLTGWSGLFTKIGLNGLPLATIALTLIFALLSFFENDSANFIDFTKLTLGAFLGSYVQRSVGEKINKIENGK